MLDTVMGLVGARQGHFALESGHHGELWLELDDLCWSAAALEPVVEELAARLRSHRVDAVCGPLAGGAFLAQLVAARTGVGFAYTERASVGDGLYSASYRLPAVQVARLSGLRVAVLDDAVNAGSATRATVAAVRAAGGVVVALAAMLVLGRTPSEYAAGEGLPLEAVAEVDNAIWTPAECPRCARGEALVSP